MSKIQKFKKHEISSLNKIKGGYLSTTYEAGAYNCLDQWYLFSGNNPTNAGSAHTEYTTNCTLGDQTT